MSKEGKNMKTSVIGFLVICMMTSCMNHYCPTYSGSRGYSEKTASAIKIKPSKNKKASYKAVKKAEQD